MIAIARRNLSCLFFSPNSFLCNPNVLSVHFFSTASVIRSIPSPEIYHVLFHKHNLSPKSSSLAASCLPKFQGPERADSMLSFLKENSFTSNQLEKIVMYKPQILGFPIERLKSIFKVFQDLGLSSEEIAKMMSSDKRILLSSKVKVNHIISSLSILKVLLGSNEEVARLLKRCSWFVRSDLEKILMPNVEILKSCGIPMERILHFLYTQPRCFFSKPDIVRKSVDRAIKFGVPQTSIVFIQAIGVFSCMSEGLWEVKLKTLRDLGFSDDNIFTMFRKTPLVFTAPGKKVKNVIELLLATGKYNISSIATAPSALGCSIEKRLEPRLQILRLLESRNLIEKWPALSRVATLTDDGFFDRFVRPYYDKIGEENITKICVGWQKEMNL
ncbi:uncharacterized protein LOC131001899 [Salvia miltiorrhiza]|uniref:uncharacterized protein LOC131001899 n=1 Tax=Salvia miltiorrhiza TaxID=226208 RepID=UPI0025AD6A56|nr:uncharacterized protein LOC131001899 [Salvia miltiorrhiza]